MAMRAVLLHGFYIESGSQEIGSMRISGGTARGVTLSVPKGDAVRPATDGMRQAVFSSLAAYIPDAFFLDLFAGSGAYGLEAWSRGAKGGVFVEKNSRTVECLRKNIAAVSKSIGRAAGDLRVLQGDVLQWPLGIIEIRPDIVFVDPPYEIIPTVGPLLFERLSEVFGESDAPLVVFEMPGETELSPPGWSCLKRLGGGARQPSVCYFRTSRG